MVSWIFGLYMAIHHSALVPLRWLYMYLLHVFIFCHPWMNSVPIYCQSNADLHPWFLSRLEQHSFLPDTLPFCLGGSLKCRYPKIDDKGTSDLEMDDLGGYPHFRTIWSRFLCHNPGLARSVVSPLRHWAKLRAPRSRGPTWHRARPHPCKGNHKCGWEF